jgi:mannitol-1-phosphate 5-dehydrogenase
MQQATVFGAGNIGRGFIGQLFCEAGWMVTFLDVDPTLVGALASEHSYPHVTVSTSESVRTVIGPVTAIDSRDAAAVDALVAADAVATAVGARVLPRIVPVLAEAISQRIEDGRPPLNVLLCENLHGAAEFVRAILAAQLPQLPPDMLDANVGLLETSIGRMIPAPDPSLLAAEPTMIQAEPYKQLPYDAAALRGEPLLVPGLVGITDIPSTSMGTASSTSTTWAMHSPPTSVSGPGSHTCGRPSRSQPFATSCEPPWWSRRLRSPFATASP